MTFATRYYIDGEKNPEESPYRCYTVIWPKSERKRSQYGKKVHRLEKQNKKIVKLCEG